MILLNIYRYQIQSKIKEILVLVRKVTHQVLTLEIYKMPLCVRILVRVKKYILSYKIIYWTRNKVSNKCLKIMIILCLKIKKKKR
jgi:hypothetical protein